VKRTDQDGFALVTTLWFVALLALVAVIVEGWVSTSLDRALALKARAAAHVELTSVGNSLAFVMLNGGLSPRGLELVPPPVPAAGSAQPATSGAALMPDTPFIALDGRPYRIGNVVVRLQDEGGLYDLSHPNRQTLNRLLKSYGTPDTDNLYAALLDYLGKSPDLRADPARDSEYSSAGLPPPRRAPLLTPWELSRVLGWQRISPLRSGPDPLSQMVTIGPIGGLNLNTAPARVLTAITGMDEEAAARLVAERVGHPITNALDIASTLEQPPSEDQPLFVMPSNIIRLTATVVGDPLLHSMAIRLTPSGPAPYRIDFVVDLPQNAATRGPARAEPLPELPQAPSQ
jgi:type II secretory pathway component PulK